MFAALLPLAIAAAQAGTPPRIESARIARPAEPASARSVDVIEIRLTAEGAILWEGSLRVSPNQAASYQHNRSEAPPEQCPAHTPFDRSQRHHVNVSLHAQGQGQWPNLYRIDISWARPAVRDGCGDAGTRTVQVSQTVSIEPGESVVVEGDGGLALRLARRR